MTETFNVTQPDLSNSWPICRLSVVTTVEISATVVGSSTVVKVDAGSKVKLGVKDGVKIVVWAGQCGR